MAPLSCQRYVNVPCTVPPLYHATGAPSILATTCQKKEKKARWGAGQWARCEGRIHARFGDNDRRTCRVVCTGCMRHGCVGDRCGDRAISRIRTAIFLRRYGKVVPQSVIRFRISTQASFFSLSEQSGTPHPGSLFTPGPSCIMPSMTDDANELLILIIIIRSFVRFGCTHAHPRGAAVIMDRVFHDGSDSVQLTSFALNENAYIGTLDNPFNQRRTYDKRLCSTLCLRTPI